MAKKTTAKKGTAPPKGASTPRQIKPLQIVRDKDAPVFYSNRVQVSVTQGEFALGFLERLREDEHDEGPLAREVTRIYISPFQAKAVRDLMKRQVDFYEERFGELSDTPGPSTG